MTHRWSHWWRWRRSRCSLVRRPAQGRQSIKNTPAASSRHRSNHSSIGNKWTIEHFSVVVVVANSGHVTINPAEKKRKKKSTRTQINNRVKIAFESLTLQISCWGLEAIATALGAALIAANNIPQFEFGLAPFNSIAPCSYWIRGYCRWFCGCSTRRKYYSAIRIGIGIGWNGDSIYYFRFRNGQINGWLLALRHSTDLVHFGCIFLFFFSCHVVCVIGQMWKDGGGGRGEKRELKKKKIEKWNNNTKKNIHYFPVMYISFLLALSFIHFIISSLPFFIIQFFFSLSCYCIWFRLIFCAFLHLVVSVDAFDFLIVDGFAR